MSQPVPAPLPERSNGTVETNNPATGTFWHSFTVFLWPFERFCVQRWYILLIVYFVIMFATALITDLAFGSLYLQTFFQYGYFPFSYFSLVFNSWIFNALIAAMFLLLGI